MWASDGANGPSSRSAQFIQNEKEHHRGTHGRENDVQAKYGPAHERDENEKSAKLPLVWHHDSQ